MYPLIGRDEHKIKCIEAYLKATKMYRNYNDSSEDPTFSEVRLCFVCYNNANNNGQLCSAGTIQIYSTTLHYPGCSQGASQVLKGISIRRNKFLPKIAITTLRTRETIVEYQIRDLNPQPSDYESNAQTTTPV